jgi:large subunit ribosomal protein L4
MPMVDVYNLKHESVGTIDLSEAVFDASVREHLFHEVVRAQMASKRSGNAKVKERGEIRGSRRKLWKQKGTGRARVGDRKAPHWVGGGIAHGPRTRDYAIKVNKKLRREALRCALSRRQQEGRLLVLEDFQLEAIKTKSVTAVLSAFDAQKALIVDGPNETLALSTNNLAASNYLTVDQLNVYDVLLHDTLLVTRRAVEAIEGRLGK